MVNAGAKAPHLVPRGLAPAQELHTPVLEKPTQELEARAVGAASSEVIEIVSGVERPRSLGLRPHRPGARLLSNTHLHPGGQPWGPTVAPTCFTCLQGCCSPTLSPSGLGSCVGRFFFFAVST